MRRPRKTPMNREDIIRGIRRVKTYARDDLKAIHLAKPDYEKVQRRPAAYNVTKEDGGRLTTIFRGRRIDVLPMDH